MEQIGNSVPPGLAQVIAVSVREQLLRKRRTLTYPVRSIGFRSTFRRRQRDRTNYFKEVARKEVAQRFPNVVSISTAAVDETESYFVGYDGRFSKHTSTLMTDLVLGRAYYAVTERRVDDEIVLAVSPAIGVKRRSMKISVEISGLSKYLIDVDRLVCTAQCNGLDDLFRVWSMIEGALIKGSQFFTLIDIYGHYANRGDTVHVRTAFGGSKRSAIERAIEFFGRSENSGEFMSQREAARELDVSEADLTELIAQLRSMRWDVRSSKTHPTIQHNAILCTYPFPLLSGKAQLERKLNHA